MSLPLCLCLSSRRCLEGVSIVLSSAFRLDMAPVPLLPGEAWCDGILKFEFSRGGENVGTIYVDPFVRANKYDGTNTPPAARTHAQ